MTGINRRTFMASTAFGSAALMLSPLRTFGQSPSTAPLTLPAGKKASDFLVHSDLPWALETRRSHFGFGPITPASKLFVRNNLPMPRPAINRHPDEWAFQIEGTKQTGSLTLTDLKAMNVQTVASVLQCSGNGRAFFKHQPSGSLWGVGAAGCVLWTGVPVADVLAHFGGVRDGLPYLTTTGGEPLPKGLQPEQVMVERSIPIDKGLKDCLLVWEMNGAPLSLLHGGPVRLIVPGYFGVNNVKWVTRLAAAAEQSSANIQQSSYRVRPIGEASSSQQPSMWRMPVKSWLNGPGADAVPVLLGPAVLYGVAFSGERGVGTVEISGDNGASWQTAKLVGPDLGPNAWRAFKHGVELKPGVYRFVSRATDREGYRQPRLRAENDRGYGHNGWLDAALEVNVVDKLPARDKFIPEHAADSAAETIVAAEPAQLSAEAQRGRDIYISQAQPPCGVCHGLADVGSKGVVGPNLDTLKPTSKQVQQAVAQGVGAIPAFGGQLSQQEIKALASYIFEATR